MANERKPIMIVAPNNEHANFSVHSWNDECVMLEDIGPWDQYSTITNDAEWVVEQMIYLSKDKLKGGLQGRRLFYIDSDKKMTELIYDTSGFKGFGHYPLPEKPELKDRLDQLIIDEDEDV